MKSSELSRWKKARFYFHLATIYLLTGLFIIYCLKGAPAVSAQTVLLPQRPVIIPPNVPLISGKPVRIVIPQSAVDLTIEDGQYDPADNSWTLSGYHAHYALVSSPANNRSGMTFIYGHNNNYVFGPLRHVTPLPGAAAIIYTDNGHVFKYVFESATSLTPNDASVLNYQGPPILAVLTCTGSVNEWRTLYKFNYVSVDK